VIVPICGMELIPAETSADGLAMNEIKMTKKCHGLSQRSNSKGWQLLTSDSKNDISLSGKIKMNEEANAIQASYFDGRIERLNVDYVWTRSLKKVNCWPPFMHPT